MTKANKYINIYTPPPWGIYIIGANMKKERFRVTGMTCSACSSHVEKAVLKLDGVEKVSVNLLSNSMTAEYDESRLTASDIEKAVEKAGYGAKAENFKGQSDIVCERKISEGKENKKDSKGFKKFVLEIKNDQMLKRLILSLIFMIILMYFSMGHMFSFPMPYFFEGTENGVTFAFFQFLLCLLIIYINRSYYINGYKSLFKGAPNMDSLIAIGSTASLIYGIYAIFIMSYSLGAGDLETVDKYLHELYFESAAMILALVTVGKYLESLSKKKTGDALAKLKNLVPDTAIKIVDGNEITVNSSSLKAGDLIAVKAGMSSPADAVIVEGNAFFDESAISGESVPVEKTVKEKIIGGTILKSGYVKAQVTAAGEESVLYEIINLVEEAGTTKAPVSKIADKISGIFVPVVMIISLITFLSWIISGAGFSHSFSCAVSVLVISCPCALGLATPVAITVATGKGAQYGILIKSGEALETLHNIDCVVFDKTGTITEGKLRVCEILINENQNDILKAVCSIERKSEHPLGEALVEYAKENNIEFVEVGNFETLPGKGVIAYIGNDKYAIGGKRLMDEMKIDENLYIESLNKITSEGKTPLLISVNGSYKGMISTIDKIKPTSKEAVNALKKLSIKTVMLTGDNKRAAEAIAKQVGIEEVFAEVLPQDKENKIKKLKEKYKTAMVGDGINDAPALMQADVGIAIGSGSDIAIDSADAVLIKNDLNDVVNAIKLGRKTLLNIKENLFWAFFYNCLGIPIAAGALYYTSAALKLNPMIAAAAMSISSIFVVLNALRLKLINFDKNKKNNGYSKKNYCFKTQPDCCKKSVIIHNKVKDKIKINKKRRNKMEIYTLKVEGMMCEHCKGRVEKALSEIKGVEKVTVSLNDKTATAEGKNIDKNQLIELIENQGYKVTAIL